ncbi:hypothetical protein EI94DRAFT_1725124 [Lactarius quietus]|nr:hypothetical protein EI94DRAFT_1725124 [Lactarius quietus]
MPAWKLRAKNLITILVEVAPLPLSSCGGTEGRCILSLRDFLLTLVMRAEQQVFPYTSNINPRRWSQCARRFGLALVVRLGKLVYEG